MLRGLRTPITLAFRVSFAAVFALVPHRYAAGQSSRAVEKPQSDTPPDPAAKPKPKRRKKPVTKKPTKITAPEPDTSVEEEWGPLMVSPSVETKPEGSAPPVVVSPPAAAVPLEPAPAPAPVITPPREPALAVAPSRHDGGAALHFGVRYRLGVLPQPLISLFARGGGTYIFHFLGVDLDMRWRRFSVTPALSYASLATSGDLFGDKNRLGPGHVVYLRSDLNAVLATADFAWTIPLSHELDVELGAALGVGIPFGDLINNWAYATDAGPLKLGNARYAPCKTVNDGVGCRPQDHPAEDAPMRIRINGYKDRRWTEGGSSPTVIPWIAIPQVALRIRVTDTLAMRVGVGLATTGVWFGLGLSRALSSEQHEH
jgi:hypothetical protein